MRESVYVCFIGITNIPQTIFKHICGLHTICEDRDVPSALICAAVGCSVLQCVAVCCSVLQRVADSDLSAQIPLQD